MIDAGRREVFTRSTGSPVRSRAELEFEGVGRVSVTARFATATPSRQRARRARRRQPRRTFRARASTPRSPRLWLRRARRADLRALRCRGVCVSADHRCFRSAAGGRPRRDRARSSGVVCPTRGRARCSPASSRSRRRSVSAHSRRPIASRLPDHVSLRRRVARDEHRRGRDYRRRGIATALMDEVVRATRRGPAWLTRWRCASRTWARSSCTSAWVSPPRLRRGYYTDNREDALIMWRDPRSEREQ